MCRYSHRCNLLGNTCLPSSIRLIYNSLCRLAEYKQSYLKLFIWFSVDYKYGSIDLQDLGAKSELISTQNFID